MSRSSHDSPSMGPIPAVVLVLLTAVALAAVVGQKELGALASLLTTITAFVVAIGALIAAIRRS
jgi:hypothetical protein